MERKDMLRPTRVQVEVGSRRVWWKPWKREPIWKSVWFGTITGFHSDMQGSTLELRDAMYLYSRAYPGEEL